VIRSIVVVVAIAAAGLLAPSRARAQTGVPPLPARLAPATRADIARLMDSARVAGLPVAPLADKAAEGVLKGADDARIVAAVRTLARELGDARLLLGDVHDAVLLTATASALHAGVAPPDLRRLARGRAGEPPDAHALASALVTLVDLIAKQISPVSATSAVGELLERRATDAQFTALRVEVDQDIRAGVAPDAALSKRVRSQAETLDALTPGGRPVKRPPPPPPAPR